jgi:gamma-glutamylcyclotransferase (GGCT)/AIG2-like uncharacterized protein YtfP
MDRVAMARRCPRSNLLGRARLMRHRFLISSDGYASVLRDPKRAVWGVVWDLALADVAALDRYEDLANGLYVKVFLPVLTQAGPRRAMLYVGRFAEAGAPRPGYMEGVFAAAAEAGLPRDYLHELAAWEPTRSVSQPVKKPAFRPLFTAPQGARRRVPEK